MTDAVKKVRRSQHERRAATREALLRAAIDCICEVGYAGATASIIADRANVTRGAVQHHFGSRDELIIAVIERVAELNFDMDTGRLRALTVTERIEAIIAAYRAVFSSKPFQAALNIWLGVGGEPDLHARLSTLMDAVQAPVGGVWREAFADINMPAEALQAIRRVVMSAVRGYAIHELFGGKSHWREDARVLEDMTLHLLAPLSC